MGWVPVEDKDVVVVADMVPLVVAVPVALALAVGDKLVTMRTAPRLKTCVELSQSQPVNP